MQLKLRRSQRETGVLSKNAVFCLDARVQFTPPEMQSLTRYKLLNQVIYNSEASRRLLDKADARNDGTTRGALKGLATTALAAMRLNITVASLSRGQHVECKSLDELLGAEEAIMEACQNLKGYLDTAATFDGREMLFDFSSGQPEAIAQSVSPDPILMAPSDTRHPEDAEWEELPNDLTAPLPLPEDNSSYPTIFQQLKLAWDDPVYKPYIIVAALIAAAVLYTLLF